MIEKLEQIKQIDMAEDSEEYKAFVEKFKPKHTTDDCFTPDNIYETVKRWALKRYNLPQDVQIIRPFFPGGDYQREEYPAECVVIDNPPFSIAAQIVDWYQTRGIRFFLFANGLTAGGVAWSRKGVTAVCAGANVTYANGANVCTNFLTNMSPELLTESVPDLYNALSEENKKNRRAQSKQVTKLSLPDHIVTTARMKYLSIHGTALQVTAGSGIFVRKLDNYAGNIFGGGLLLSERAAAERAAARRVPLSDREREMVQTLAH